jgi:hypothetical protein
MKTFTGMIALLVAVASMTGCNDTTDPGETLTQQAAISECGGFTGVNMKNPLGDPATYCAAEMLHFEYDAAAESLLVANNRILLNCCGDHTMRATLENGVYVLREQDAPEFGDARCGCMCVFDFTVDVQGIAAGVIPIRVEREVTDGEGGNEVIFEGDLDLSAGSGSIEIDPTDVEPWCSGEMID